MSENTIMNNEELVVEFEQCEEICNAAEKMIARIEGYLKTQVNNELNPEEMDEMDGNLVKIQKCLDTIYDYGKHAWLDKGGDWQHGTGYDWLRSLKVKINDLRNEINRPRTPEDIIDYYFNAFKEVK